MTAPIFVDTNVLIYALDQADRNKHQAPQLQADQELDGIIVVNPFLKEPTFVFHLL